MIKNYVNIHMFMFIFSSDIGCVCESVGIELRPELVSERFFCLASDHLAFGYNVIIILVLFDIRYRAL